MTVLVQSSSVVASALTPLVGLGLVTVERVFPMMLGANIGTTSTAILAAFATSGNKLDAAFQIALCHFFFNITGILIWYPLPFMRKVPIAIARFLGRITARYRWFAFAYILIMFFFVPLTVFALSLPGWYLLAAVGIPFLLVVITVLIVNVLQRKKPNWLPARLRTWDFLPEPLRSLEPLDRQITRLSQFCSCCKCCKKCLEEDEPAEIYLDSEDFLEERERRRSSAFLKLESRKNSTPYDNKTGGIQFQTAL